ncbi:MAG: hypothetical protein ABI895_19250 [Deltaproteobacteria bacterium]
MPTQYGAIARALQRLVVELQIDHETFSVSAGPDGLAITGAAPSAHVRLSTASQTIASLIDGTLDLVDAVLAESMALFGSVDQLLSFNDALAAYLHGVVRSAGQDEILRDFKSLAQSRAKKDRAETWQT